MSTLVWDSPAEVKWSRGFTSDRFSAQGDTADSRRFPTLADAVRFVMEDLALDPKMNVGVYPDCGSALIDLSEIEQAYRSGPHGVDEPGGVA